RRHTPSPIFPYTTLFRSPDIRGYGGRGLMMQAASRDLNIAYAFFERNWNLTRRYIGWEVVWLVYSLVNALTILFIAAATERITGDRKSTRLNSSHQIISY